MKEHEKFSKQNPMREIKVGKITINVGVGEAGERLERAKKMLSKITGRTPIETLSKKRSTFGVSKGKPIGAKVTLRGKDAIEFLKKAFDTIENKLKASQFDKQGSFSFGIKEYIDIPGIKYDPEIGMIGMDVAVTLERPGYRIAVRRIKRQKIGKKHFIKKEEYIEWMKRTFNVDVIEE